MYTFVILKPGFVHLRDQIEKEFLAPNNIGIFKEKKMQLTLKQAAEFYKEHYGKDFYSSNCHYMSSGECIVMILEDLNIADKQNTNIDFTPFIEKFRTILKDNIRKKYGETIQKNVMHASDSTIAYFRESQFLFPDV